MQLFQALFLLASIQTAAAYCSSDESALNSYAEKNSKGKSPDGMCYSHVADYIE